MWLFNKINIIIFTVFFGSACLGQSCFYEVKFVFLEENEIPVLSQVHLSSNELNNSLQTSTNGEIELLDICKGALNVEVSSIGFSNFNSSYIIEGDTLIRIHLKSAIIELDEASIIGKPVDLSIEEKNIISELQLKENPHLNLAESLDGELGVSTLRTGSASSKPIIHGLFGQRITILNHGLAQSGQQWGLDHAPELDPFSASEISVIKGVSALEYPGNSLGGVIKVFDKYIVLDSVMHGSIGLTYMSNGRGGGGQISLSKGQKKLSWGIQGNISRSGDMKSADYLLKNTGRLNYSASGQLELRLTEKWHTKIYGSTFNQEVGILRGSHIGNLTDLETALERDEPFFTTDTFSYTFNAPFQEVSHHLGRISSSYRWNTEHSTEITLGMQWNARKEFDVRRGGRSTSPTLSLYQENQYTEVKHTFKISEGTLFKCGFQWDRTDNENVPETDILPLIPDYISREWGIYSLLRKDWKTNSISLGVRMDTESRRVASITNSIPREIARFNNLYRNYSSSIGWKKDLNRNTIVKLNLGVASRNPEVNELYSGGLHQGVSGIEEGNLDLNPEVSYKQTLSISKDLKKRLKISILAYHQYFEEFIFLKPTSEVRLTIRGAFPVFKYHQANSRIVGSDFQLEFKASENLEALIRYSYLRGQNLAEDLPLVYMPSNRISNNWRFSKELKDNFSINVNAEIDYIFKQTHLESEQDFVEPPDGYMLASVLLSIQKRINEHEIKLLLRADNILNNSFRDYLDRQRYFTDGLGRNMVVGLQFKF